MQKHRLKYGRTKNPNKSWNRYKEAVFISLSSTIDRVMLNTGASVGPSKTTGEHASLAPIPSEQQHDKIAGLLEMKNV